MAKKWLALAGTVRACVFVARGVGLVHDDFATAKLRAVQFGDGAFGHFGVGQLNKSKAARSSRLSVGDDFYLGYGARARLFKKILNVLFFRCIRQIANIKTSSHSHFPFQRGIAHKATQYGHMFIQTPIRVSPGIGYGDLTILPSRRCDPCPDSRR